MTIHFLPAQEKQKYFVWTFLTLVVLGGFMFWYGYLREETISLFQGSIPPPPEEISLDFQIFEDPIFEELGMPVSEIPVPEAAQRQNPFVPN